MISVIQLLTLLALREQLWSVQVTHSPSILTSEISLIYSDMTSIQLYV